MEECNSPDVCRTCLSEEGELQSVFAANETTGLNIHLAEMIMAFTSVQVNFGDGLPEKICAFCAESTVKFYLFKLKCEESDRRLRDKVKQLDEPPLPVVPDASAQTLQTEETAVSSAVILEPEVLIKNEIENSENKAKVPEETSPSEEVQYIGETNEDFFYTFGPNNSDSDDQDNKQDLLVKEECDTNKKCPHCDESFTKLSAFNRHLKTHAEYKPFECSLCKKRFTRGDLLIRHKIAHAIKLNNKLVNFSGKRDSDGDGDSDSVEKKNFQLMKSEEESLSCHECGAVFINDTELKTHCETHKSLSCKECKKKFTKQIHLRRHMKIHDEKKPYVCHLCNKGFIRHKQLTNHLNVHSGVKPHVCKTCGKGFNQISNLKDHTRTHNGEKPFLCSTCGKGFNQLGNLRQHSIRHTGIKAHLCSTCGSGFASKGELSAHLRKHTGARPFVCEVCHHGFTTSSSLTKHKRIHSGEKPYECDVCKMKFSRSGILARHKRIHTGEKPYQCTFCTKAFAQSNDLTSHLRIHTGEKPYICDSCGSAFRQSSALKSHKKTHQEKNSVSVDSKPFVGIVQTAFLGIFNDHNV